MTRKGASTPARTAATTPARKCSTATCRSFWPLSRPNGFALDGDADDGRVVEADGDAPGRIAQAPALFVPMEQAGHQPSGPLARDGVKAVLTQEQARVLAPEP